MYIKLVLKGRIPSKKNQKQRTGKRLISSQQYLKRESEQLEALKEQVNKLKLAGGLYAKYVFYMPDNRVTDLSNKVESVNDLLVKYGLIEDDNRKVLNELYITCNGVDKANPRVEVEICTKNQFLFR